MIPPRLIRSIPAEVTAEVEDFWDKACDLHPDWDHVTFREPIDPAWFPYTSDLWPLCQNGAQKAGLIRLEALLHGGGIYIDSDVELYRPLDPLSSLRGFAAWEDERVVPDAVLGAEADHPAIRACLALASDRILDRTNADWATGYPTWSTGPGVTTTVLPGRDDFLLLPPWSFYPYHYKDRHRRNENHATAPWVFGAHHWAGSWLPEEARH